MGFAIWMMMMMPMVHALPMYGGELRRASAQRDEQSESTREARAWGLAWMG